MEAGSITFTLVLLAPTLAGASVTSDDAQMCKVFPVSWGSDSIIFTFASLSSTLAGIGITVNDVRMYKLLPVSWRPALLPLRSQVRFNPGWG